MTRLFFFVFIISASPALAIIGERPPAPYGRSVPYKGGYICYGRWITTKRQVLDGNGHSVSQVGHRCVDDPKIRRKMLSAQ